MPNGSRSPMVSSTPLKDMPSRTLMSTPLWLCTSPERSPHPVSFSYCQFAHYPRKTCLDCNVLLNLQLFIRTSADLVIELGPQTYEEDPICAPCYQYAVVRYDCFSSSCDFWTFDFCFVDLIWGKTNWLPTLCSCLLISDPYGISLFVLTRSVEEYVSTYNHTVYNNLINKFGLRSLSLSRSLSRARAFILLNHLFCLGFTKLYNKPLYTYQGNDCEYAPQPQLE